MRPEQLAVPGRPGGYIGYWRQLEFELRSGLVPIDAVDASALRPGTHEVEVRNVRHVVAGGGVAGTSRGGDSGRRVRVTFVGKAGRRHTHEFAREDWDAFGAAVGSTCVVRLVRTEGASLARAPSGLVVAVEGDRILGAFPSVEAARAAVDVSELFLEYAEVIR